MANVTLRDPDGTRAKLVEVAAVVQDRLPTAVLIGGLAVVCRCVQHGRVTQDVDTVLDNKYLQAVELADLGEVAGENRVYVDGVKVDVLGVDKIAPGVVIAEQVDGARQQLFVAAHRWAADCLCLRTSSPPQAAHDASWDLSAEDVPGDGEVR